MSSHADVKHMAMDEFTRAESAAMVIRMQLSQKPHLGVPEIAVVLGSGLGAFAEALKDSVVIPYNDIPNFPRSTAVGHAGRLVVGKIGDLTVAAMQGRVHQYEGYSSREAGFPVRVLGRLGIKSLVLTNAAGGINSAYQQRRAGRAQRPHQSAGQQPAQRAQRRTLWAALSGYERGLFAAAIACLRRRRRANLALI